ncbi:questin oxidase family protein [Photobacterium rosenbergii]|uniref:Questin oxidase family protein n=1 Tax=Photobacterium rosenbergii TaxID=294936 RepID=A0ABU3ZNF0_9GAMM|nr:questin oxidase family protein [Photobacterium rosenbergii]MDV5171647.1 questin oxidase family protein [Photobacterium rosenbergii]
MFQSISPKALQLIRQGQQFDPSYQGGLSNHLPMALAALSFSGATDFQLEAFYRHYIPRLEPIRQASSTAKSGTAILGNKQHFPYFLHAYRQQVEKEGIEQTVKNAIPQLLPGLATAAFHALIRLSYAVQVQDKAETAIALAYWSSEFQPLGDLEITHKYQGLEQAQMAFGHFKDYSFQPGNIVDRIDQLTRIPEYQAISAIPADLTFEAIAQTSIRLYLASGNFTLLHGVTGLQALHALMPLIGQKGLAVNYFWQSYIAALCVSRANSISMKVVQTSPLASNEQWKIWLGQTLSNKDDHVVKLAYSCAYLHQYFSLPEYPAAVNALLAHQVV